MANIASAELFSAPVVTRVVSSIAAPYARMQEWSGLGIGSSLTEDRLGRDFSWDTFNTTRKIAHGRSPNAGPGTIAPQNMGAKFGRALRLHDKMMLLDELIYAKRSLGGDFSQVDESGQRYVARQQGILAQTFRNAREFMVSRMFKGGFGLKLETGAGESYALTEYGTSGNIIDIDYGIPAGNKDQLNVDGGGDVLDVAWSTLSADIPKQLANLNGKSQALSGRGISDIWCSSKFFHQYVANNTVIQAQGGTANQYFASYGNSSYTGPDGQKDTGKEIVLRAIPWIVWHLYDAVLEVNGTVSPLLDDGHIIITCSPDGSWLGGFNGSEMVRENVTSQSELKYGFYSWTEPNTQPAGVQLIAVDNFLPVLYVPSAVFYADPIF
jgi:hypothetical protein